MTSWSADFEVIERNSARCGGCCDELVSEHAHDFKWCTCGALAVDGGLEYRRRVCKADVNYEETSVFTVETREFDL